MFIMKCSVYLSSDYRRFSKHKVSIESSGYNAVFNF